MATTIRRAKLHYDGMLDLQSVPREAHWYRDSSAIRRLDDERGRPWRLKLLIQDTPEAATVLPGLVAELGHAGLVYDFVREPGGGQGVHEARISIWAVPPSSAMPPKLSVATRVTVPEAAR